MSSLLLILVSAATAQFASNSQTNWGQICQNGVCQQSGNNCINGVCTPGGGSPYQWGNGNPNWYQNGQYDPNGFYSGLGYPMNNPGCLQNPQFYGCPQGPMLPPQVPTIPQCQPTWTGCPGGPVFQGCNPQTYQYTPGCSYGGQITPIPGCTAQIAGCPGYVGQVQQAGCPQNIVPGCIQNPTVPGCSSIPQQCYQQMNQIPYVRNFGTINQLSALLAQNSSSPSSSAGSNNSPTTGTNPTAAFTPRSAAFSKGFAFASLSAFLITAVIFA